MKEQPNRARIRFAVSFFGAAVIGALALYAGNTWLTVYERAAISFILLWLVTYFALGAFQWIAAQEMKTVGNSFDQTLPPEVPVFSNEHEDAPQPDDFIPWTFPPASGRTDSNPSETKR